MWQEMRYSFRQLARRKSLSAVVILLFALGIGANAVIFQFVNAVLLRPLPVHDPNSLFLIEKMSQKQLRPDTSCGYRLYEQIAARSDLFSSAVAAQEWFENSFQPWQNGDTVKMISTQVVSPNYFSDLDVKTIIGRPLTIDDSRAISVAVSRPLALRAKPDRCTFCAENFQAGIEVYGGLGTHKDFGLTDTSQYLGPTAAWQVPNGPLLRLSPEFGVTGQSLPVLFRFSVSYKVAQAGRAIREMFAAGKGKQ